jgi:RNA polymerase sigma factor (sigma-70 family)
MEHKGMQRLLNMTDRQLLTAYVSHDDVRAFDAFVDRHQSALLSFTAAFLRDETSAQDVVQETFMRAARFPQRLLHACSNGASERNWLLKVARDLSIDNLRRKSTERVAFKRMAEVAPKSAPAADAALETRERNEQVHRAIDKLKPRLRELLILKVREQKSYREISEITGLSVTNVGFLLHQAMTALAEELKQTVDS